MVKTDGGNHSALTHGRGMRKSITQKIPLSVAQRNDSLTIPEYQGAATQSLPGMR